MEASTFNPIVKNGILLFFAATSIFRLYGEDASYLKIGSGEPGLHIIYNSADQYVIFLDEPWTTGSFLIGGYNDRKIRVLADQNYGLKEMMQSHTWNGQPNQLYPFDEKTVFTVDGNAQSRVTRVFAMYTNGLSVSNDVYALACSRYGLAANQLFLGKIGTNVFYWETQDPTTVYFHAAVKAQTTNYFRLPKRVFDINGVLKAANTNKDVGFFTWGKSAGWFHYSPNTWGFIEVSFKNAKRIETDQ